MKLPERMSRPEFWTAAFTGVLAVATLWAIWYARGQLKEAHQEAQVQHLLTFIQQFEQEPMATYRRQLAEKRLKNEDEPDELWDELNFFDTIGLLVEKGYLNETHVWDSFSYWVFDLNADATPMPGMPLSGNNEVILTPSRISLHSWTVSNT